MSEEPTPVQRDVLEALGSRPHERPTFDPRLREWLRDDLDAGLGPLLDGLDGDRQLWLSKHDLGAVHGCEAAYLADRDEPFEWTTATARGTVAHKAVELSVHWRGEPVPGDLVDEAMARLAGGNDALGTWLAALDEGERAELRGEAVDRVAKFLEVFPPLESRWRPVAESRLRAELAGDRVVLAGKADLTVGRAAGLVAGKVIIDLKTGGFSPAHRDDLRFYALVESLRLGVPPRLLATLYLDSGRLVTEAVTEDVLQAAVQRTLDGARALVELRTGREPVRRPGVPCRWCPLRPECPDGRRWLEDRDDQDGW
ncbi:MAG: PD-(D/E)XK nuclease family protein [Acidimicrobiia bacterium]